MMLCALIMNLPKTFAFDATQRILRWKGRTVLKAESGEISFDDITHMLSSKPVCRTRLR